MQKTFNIKYNLISLTKRNYYIIIWIIILSSIGVEPYTIFEIKNININYFINFFRNTSFIFILLFLIIYYLKNNFYYKNNFFLFLIIFFTQSIGIFFEESNTFFFNVDGNINYFNKVYLLLWLLKPITSILFLIFINNQPDSQKKIKKIFLFTLIFISILGIGNFFIAFYEFFFEHPGSYLMYSGLKTYWTNILGQLPPQTLGISRNLVILFIFLLFYFWLSSFQKRKNKYLLIIVLIFLATFIYLLQSRTHIYFLLILFFIFIFYEKNKLYSKFFIVLVIISGTLFNTYFIQVAKKFYKKNETNEIYNIFKSKDLKSVLNTRATDLRKLEDSSLDKSISSGRLEDWKLLIKINSETTKTIIFGNGVRADRRLINQSASSSIVYLYCSGGLIALFIFLILLINIARKLILLYYNYYNNQLKLNYLDFTSIFIIIFLSIRSIVEVSFVDWGVDFIFFILATQIINYKIFQIHKK